MSPCMRKPTICILASSNTNGAVQSQKVVRSFKFRIHEEEELLYPLSENEGADQLCSYCEADLRVCFCICRLLVFLCCGSFHFLVFKG